MSGLTTRLLGFIRPRRSCVNTKREVSMLLKGGSTEQGNLSPSARTSLHHQLQDPLSLSLFIGKVRCWIRSSLKILLVLNSYYVSTFSGFSILTCMPVINTAIQCDGQTIVQGTNLACGLFSYCL